MTKKQVILTDTEELILVQTVKSFVELDKHNYCFEPSDSEIRADLLAGQLTEPLIHACKANSYIAWLVIHSDYSRLLPPSETKLTSIPWYQSLYGRIVGASVGALMSPKSKFQLLVSMSWDNTEDAEPVGASIMFVVLFPLVLVSSIIYGFIKGGSTGARIGWDARQVVQAGLTAEADELMTHQQWDQSLSTCADSAMAHVESDVRVTTTPVFTAGSKFEFPNYAKPIGLTEECRVTAESQLTAGVSATSKMTSGVPGCRGV